MGEKSVIFVNGFQRGGTNILVNLLASHPQVGWIGETHQIFYGEEWSSTAERWVRRAFTVPVFLGTGEHIFWINHLNKPRPLNPPLTRYVDWRMRSFAKKTLDNGYTNENWQGKVRPTDIRPLYKNVNGVVLATNLFANIYPQANFIGLVRDGLALCEGFLRRGWTAERFGKMYAAVCRQMIADADRHACYQILRFEDILASPEQAVRQIYGWLELYLDPGMKFRLQSKKSMDASGERHYLFGGKQDREIFWFSLDELPQYLRSDVNKNQIARLSEQDREVCLEHIREPMEHFGYL
jgi:hypothetical protein